MHDQRKAWRWTQREVDEYLIKTCLQSLYSWALLQIPLICSLHHSSDSPTTCLQALVGILFAPLQLYSRSRITIFVCLVTVSTNYHHGTPLSNPHRKFWGVNFFPCVHCYIALVSGCIFCIMRCVWERSGSGENMENTWFSHIRYAWPYFSSAYHLHHQVLPGW